MRVIFIDIDPTTPNWGPSARGLREYDYPDIGAAREELRTGVRGLFEGPVFQAEDTAFFVRNIAFYPHVDFSRKHKILPPGPALQDLGQNGPIVARAFGAWVRENSETIAARLLQDMHVMRLTSRVAHAAPDAVTPALLSEKIHEALKDAGIERLDVHFKAGAAGIETRLSIADYGLDTPEERFADALFGAYAVEEAISKVLPFALDAVHPGWKRGAEGVMTLLGNETQPFLEFSVPGEDWHYFRFAEISDRATFEDGKAEGFGLGASPLEIGPDPQQNIRALAGLLRDQFLDAEFFALPLDADHRSSGPCAADPDLRARARAFRPEVADGLFADHYTPKRFQFLSKQIRTLSPVLEEAALRAVHDAHPSMTVASINIRLNAFSSPDISLTLDAKAPSPTDLETWSKSAVRLENLSLEQVFGPRFDEALPQPC